MPKDNCYDLLIFISQFVTSALCAAATAFGDPVGMQLQFLSELVPSAPGGARLCGVDASPNGYRIALAGPDRIALHDGTASSLERRDKFSTKPADASSSDGYTVTAIAFSPDSTRLAVAQSDSIVFVYKLGASWADKKSICNKFPTPGSRVTSLLWPKPCAPAAAVTDGYNAAPFNEVLFGCDDGTLRVGVQRSNKSVTLFSAAGEPCVALTALSDGRTILSAHADGSVYQLRFHSSAIDDNGQLSPSAASAAATATVPSVESLYSGQQLQCSLGAVTKLIECPSPPTAIACVANDALLVAASDGSVTIYDTSSGAVVQRFDSAGSCSVASGPVAASPDRRCIVFATRSGVRIFSYRPRQRQHQQSSQPQRASDWTETPAAPCPSLRHLLSVTGLAWKPDGGALIISGACGGVEVYEPLLSKHNLGGGVTVAFSSPTAAVVTSRASGGRMAVRSRSGSAFISAEGCDHGRFIVSAASPCGANGGTSNGWRNGLMLRRGRYVALLTQLSVVVVDTETQQLTEVPLLTSQHDEALHHASDKGRDNIGGGGSGDGSCDTSLPHLLCSVHPSAVLVQQDGVLTVAVYGCDGPLGSVRCAQQRLASRDTLSLVVQNNGGTGTSSSGAPSAVLAFLSSPRVVAIARFSGDGALAMSSHTHTARVAWLQLSDSGRCLLFKDVQGTLHALALTVSTASAAGGAHVRDPAGHFNNDAPFSQQYYHHHHHDPHHQAAAAAVPSVSSPPGLLAAVLLESADFAGWVPGMEVAVAQKQRGDPVTVWYHIGSTNSSSNRYASNKSTSAAATAFPGPASAIDSRGGEVSSVRLTTSNAASSAASVPLKAEVLLSGAEGRDASGSLAVQLDPGLLSFNAALESGDYTAAAAALASSSVSGKATGGGDAGAQAGLWAQLAHAALSAGDVVAASAAAVAAGDPSLAFAVRQAVKHKEAEEDLRGASGPASSSVDAEAAAAAARLAALVGGHPNTPSGASSAGSAAVNKTIVERLHCLQDLGRWEEAAAAADAAGEQEIARTIRQRAVVLLTSSSSPASDTGHSLTGNEARAAALAEAAGDVPHAVRLFLSAGAPLRAASLVMKSFSESDQRHSAQRSSGGNSNSALQPLPAPLLEDVVAALGKAELYAAAAPLLERLGRPADALAAYVYGRSFRSALDLARRCCPDKVVPLESAWAHWLCSDAQHEAAVAHFIETGNAQGAIGAAIAGRQFIRAAQLISDTYGFVAGPPSSVSGSNNERSGAGISESGRRSWDALASAALKAGCPVTEAAGYCLMGGDAQTAVRIYLTTPSAASRPASSSSSSSVAATSSAPTAPTSLRAASASVAAATNKKRRNVTGSGKTAASRHKYALNKAHETAQAWLSQQTALSIYASAASAHDTAGRYDVAEAIWVAAGDVTPAMVSHRSGGRWDALAALVATHAPERLAETHLEAAAALVASGDVSGAERHFIDGGRWEAAAEIYSDQGRWEDARRVAALGGGPEAANRVALAQARAVAKAAGNGSGAAASDGGGPLDVPAGVALLLAAGLVTSAVDFAVEAREWALAVDIAEQHCSPDSLTSVLANVSYRHAMALEDAGQFTAAEALFIAAGRPKEAIDMHCHLQDWAAARRIAAAHDPPALTEVVIAQAKAAAAAKNLAGAEALYIEAKRPDLAVDAYISCAGFSDALRVARAHLTPQQVAAVTERVRRAMTGGAAAPEPAAEGPAAAASDEEENVGSGAAALARARTLEAQRSYTKAIDVYLSLLPSPSDSNASDSSAGNGMGGGLSLAACEEAWLHAVRLTATHSPVRLTSVTDEVGERLLQLGAGKLEAAGDLFLSCSHSLAAIGGQTAVAAHRYLARAVEAYARDQCWEKAWGCLHHSTSSSSSTGSGGGASASPMAVGQLQVEKELRSVVEAGYASYLTKKGDADGLLAIGAAEPALQLLASQQNWERTLAVAASLGGPQLARYLYPMVERYERQGDVIAAWGLLQQYGAPPYLGKEQLSLLTRLVQSLFANRTSTTDAQQAPDDRAGELQAARDILFALTSQLHSLVTEGGAVVDAALSSSLDRLLWLLHLSHWRIRYVQRGLLDLAASASLSLLRFADLIPSDQLFYTAAMDCRAAGRLGEARVLMNRYLDLAEMLDTMPRGGGGGMVDFSQIDDSDFSGAGVPAPSSFCPARFGSHYVLDAAARRQAREWVVKASMDRSVLSTGLLRAPCGHCGAGISALSLPPCTSCGAAHPLCVATGLPIIVSSAVTMGANSDGSSAAAVPVTCEACGSVCSAAAGRAVTAHFGVCPWCTAVALAPEQLQ